MAIDYKKEWEKLQKIYGSNTIVYSKYKGMPTLGDLMKSRIKTVINDREKLMEEYIKGELKTNITGGNKSFYFVSVDTQWGTAGNTSISKKDFAKWCEAKGGN